jgi:hypothetical protein
MPKINLKFLFLFDFNFFFPYLVIIIYVFLLNSDTSINTKESFTPIDVFFVGRILLCST